MLCPQFRPMVGGYERAAERLSGELVRQGCSVTVITDRRERRWPAREQVDGFTIRRLRCIYRPGLHALTSLCAHALFLLCHGRSFDVWHVHHYGVHTTLAVVLGQWLRRPVVLKLASSSEQGLANAIASGRWPTLQARAHRQVAACIAPSVETEVEARCFGISAEKIHQIGNGVDVEQFAPANSEQQYALRESLRLPQRLTAIFVGRLAAEKNPLGGLDAWAAACVKFQTPWTLVLVGDGPLRNAVEEKIKALDLADCVIVAGQSDRVQDWLRAADIYVLGSHNEGLSNTTLEAMACGLPSVVTAVSGMAALIGDTGAGRVVPVRDTAALADALVALHADAPLRAAMGIRARDTVLRNYAIGSIAERHRLLYQTLAGRRHG